MDEEKTKNLPIECSTIQDYQNQYILYMKEGLEDFGREMLEIIIQAIPKNNKECNIVIEAFVKLGKYREGLNFIEKNKSLIDVEYYFKAKSNILYFSGQNKESLRVLQTAVNKHCPRSIELLSNCAFLLDEAEQYSEAKKMYEKALKIDPGNTELFINLVAVKWHLNMYAIDDLRKIVELRPNSFEANLNLGIALATTWKYSQADYEKACKLFDKAIEIDVNRWRAHHQKGKAYWCMGKFNLAMKCFETSKKMKDAHLNKKIGRLHREFKSLSEKDVDHMILSISNQEIVLEHLDLSFNEFTGHRINELMMRLPIISIDLSHNSIDDRSIPNIVSGNMLVSLDLSYNFITDKGIKMIIENNKTILNINMEGLRVSWDALKALQENLKNNSGQLRIFAKAIRSKNIDMIESMLEKKLISPFAPIEKNLTALEIAFLNKNQKISEVIIRGYLKYYKPKLPICRHIGGLLKKYPNVLESLDLSHLNLNDNEILCLLSDVLCVSTSLMSIRLSNNLIEEKGFDCLMGVVRKNSRFNFGSEIFHSTKFEEKDCCESPIDRMEIDSPKNTPEPKAAILEIICVDKQEDQQNKSKLTIDLKRNKIMMCSSQFRDITKRINPEKISIDLSFNFFNKDTAKLFNHQPFGFFSSGRVPSKKIKSVVSPDENVTENSSLVHLLGKKEFKVSGDHALIIVEWMNNMGHLTVFTAELFVKDGVGKLHIKNCDNIRDLEIRLEDYKFCTYKKSRGEVKSFVSFLRREYAEDREYPYAMLGNKLGYTNNCLTWAVDRLYSNQIIDNDEKNRILPLYCVAIPSRAVNPLSPFK